MLDYLTALVILAAAALTVGAGLLVAWQRDRAASSFLWWASGFGATAVGLALVAAEPLPDIVTVGLANLLLLLAFAGWIWGARRLDGLSLNPEALLPAATWLISVAVPELRETFFLRFALLNAGSAIGYFLLAHAIWPRPATADAPLPAASSRRPMALFLLLAAIWNMGIAGAGLWLRPPALGGFPIAWLDGIVEVLILLVIVIYGARLVRERVEARLRTLADTDPLTGVLNRRGLGERLEQLLARTGESGGGLALLMFDLDHFKRVNDSFGHETGDLVLQAFCRRAEAQLRPDDLFGRLGGEEFAALLRVQDVAQAQEVAERIRLALAQAPVEAAGRSVPVTVSIGVALLRPGADAGTAAGPFEVADRALYAAKAGGRNRVEIAAAGGG